MAKKSKQKPVAEGLPKRQRRWSKKRRIMEAALRVLAKREGITLTKARNLYKNAYIEIITQTIDRSLITWIEISPHKFRRLPPGKKKEYDAYGPVVGRGTVSKSVNMAKYWQQVYVLAEEYGKSIKEIRKMIKKGLVKPDEYYESNMVEVKKGKRK